MTPHEMITKIANLERTLAELRDGLNEAQESCAHIWSSWQSPRPDAPERTSLFRDCTNCCLRENYSCPKCAYDGDAQVQCIEDGVASMICENDSHVSIVRLG